MFYHVSLKRKSVNTTEYKLDLREDQVLSDFVRPYCAGEPIFVGPKRIAWNDIEEVKVVKTNEDSTTLDPRIQAAFHEKALRLGVISILSKEVGVMANGENITEKLIKMVRREDELKIEKNLLGDEKGRTRVYMNKREIRIFLSGPKDVETELKAVSECIDRWNDNHSDVYGVIFTKSDWKTRASSQTGSPAQEIINDQALSLCDYLFVVFKFRFGTKTNKYESGTVHEFEWFKHNKPSGTTSLYFSSRTPQTVDEQYQKVLDFKKRIETNGDGLHKLFDSTATLQREIDIRLSYIARSLKTGEQDGSEFDALATESRKRAKELDKSENGKYGYYEIIVHPQQFLGDRFSLDELRKLFSEMKKREVDFTFPIVLGNPMDSSRYAATVDGIEFFIDKLPDDRPPFFYYVNFRQSGLLYLRVIMFEDRERDDRATFFHAENAVRALTLAVMSILVLFQKIDARMPISFEFNFEGLKGRKIGFMHECKIESFPIKKVASYAEWEKALADYEPLAMLTNLLQRFGITGYNKMEYRHVVDEIKKIFRFS